MKPNGDDAPTDQERDDGWDEAVVVWNATMARIPAPPADRDSPQDSPRGSSPLRRAGTDLGFEPPRAGAGLAPRRVDCAAWLSSVANHPSEACPRAVG